MAQTITISQTAYKDLVSRLARVESIVTELLKRFEKEPPFGSDEWWDWSIEKGREDIKAGRTVSVKNSKELKTLLNSYK